MLAVSRGVKTINDLNTVRKVDRISWREYLSLLPFVVLGALVGVLCPWQPGLSIIGHRALMGIIITIGLWVCKPGGVPFSVSGCFLMMFFLLCGVSGPTVFSGFTSSSLWVLIPALFFGHALNKTGLGKRLSYLVIKAFKPTMGGLIFAWVAIGLFLSALTPSIAVRIVIIMPLAKGSADICGLKKGSTNRALLLLTAWAMALLPGTGWLTGTLLGPVILGIYNSSPKLAGVITFASWSKAALLPVAIMNILLIIGSYFVFRPKPIPVLEREVFVKEYAKLGPVRKEEIITGFLLSLCFILFATGQLHGIPDAAICLGGLFALTAVGIIRVEDISKGISWDLPIFVGVILGLGAIFAETGITPWLAATLTSVLTPVAHNPWLFVFAVTAGLFVVRFFDVTSLILTMAILIPVIPEMSERFAINPLVWITIFVFTGKFFIMSYQNMFALIGESILGGDGWNRKQLALYGTVYLFACLVALVVAVPYWTALGFFK